LALGEENPDALLDRLPAAVFDGWLTYYTVEPFGPRAEQLRAGLLCSTAHNGLFGGERVTPATFFPSLADAFEEAEDPANDPLVLQTMFRAQAVARGWEVIEGPGPASREQVNDPSSQGPGRQDDEQPGESQPDV